MTIADLARRRGINRLCHFTPARNFIQMLETGLIQGTAELAAQGATFKQNDTSRFDGGLSHVCCSVEYPNTWYLDRVRASDPHFLDWVILTLDVGLLDRPGVRFFPHNAARGHGSAQSFGTEGFSGMFAQVVQGQQRWTRLRPHPDWWPTDDQAEVQVPGPISIATVHSVIYRSNEQQAAEVARHGMLRPLHPLPPAIVAPTLFDKYALSTSVRRGERPAERPIP
ncbi:DarT ssDNA thymidine ADP-ribosyltransferase family protein [Micromonospora aurantiaca (nom. illeg.)]|uniref:DarT ssDNA thymidine ADP-ribosyltransferase family protein n=1 Tax=Micromonospora aurantiaca (nom. illeg.) TaxID=47850 RepID=UPI003F4A5E3C